MDGANLESHGRVHEDFTRAARAGEQEGVVQPPLIERVDQRAHHVFLAGQIFETAWAPLACQDQVAHEVLRGIDGVITLLNRVAAQASHTQAPEPSAAAASFRT